MVTGAAGGVICMKEAGPDPVFEYGILDDIGIPTINR